MIKLCKIRRYIYESLMQAAAKLVDNYDLNK